MLRPRACRDGVLGWLISFRGVEDMMGFWGFVFAIGCAMLMGLMGNKFKAKALPLYVIWAIIVLFLWRWTTPSVWDLPIR